MEKIFLLTWFLIATLILLLFWVKAKKGSSDKRRPPGPPKWPVIGNMLDLGTMPHQSLYNLRLKYGSVVWLKLGLVDTMVVQSAKAAAELFKNYDNVFCDRRVPDSLTALGYQEGSLAMGQYGNDWVLLKRRCSSELRRVNETTARRRNCIDNMIRWIQEDSDRTRGQGGSGAVDVSRFLFLMAFNVVANVMVSKDILEPGSEEGSEFFEVMNRFMELAGKPNIADFFPFLKLIDPLGIKRSMVREMGRAMKIVTEFVKERTKWKQSGLEKTGKDLLDIMLEKVGDGDDKLDKVLEKNATIVILENFLAGSETTSSTIEWSLTELLRHPREMAKVKEELDQVIGTKKKVEERDIDALPYLQAVVKETHRLHPGAAFLLPRNSREDCNYMGYFIPKNTQVFVNAYAIGRDPEAWDDPLSFKPERFLEKNVDYKGQHFELIPFGSGRRICPGISLAHRTVHLALATMLQTFDWELDDGINLGATDMSERLGITLRKLVPLKAIPKKRTMS